MYFVPALEAPTSYKMDVITNILVGSQTELWKSFMLEGERNLPTSWAPSKDGTLWWPALPIGATPGLQWHQKYDVNIMSMSSDFCQYLSIFSSSIFCQNFVHFVNISSKDGPSLSPAPIGAWFKMALNIFFGQNINAINAHQQLQQSVSRCGSNLRDIESPLPKPARGVCPNLSN